LITSRQVIHVVSDILTLFCELLLKKMHAADARVLWNFSTQVRRVVSDKQHGISEESCHET